MVLVFVASVCVDCVCWITLLDSFVVLATMGFVGCLLWVVFLGLLASFIAYRLFIGYLLFGCLPYLLHID